MTDFKELLQHIDPSNLNYQDWVSVGMALKHEGLSWDVWDDWSQRDSSRYHVGECYSKWDSFNEEAGSIVTGGTIYELARQNGYEPPKKERFTDTELDWNDSIGGSEDLVVVDKSWVENVHIKQPIDEQWNPTEELIRYLSVLFEEDDHVGYVTQSWTNDKGKKVPTGGSYDRTAGKLIEELRKCKGDIGSVLGDYDPNVGAWIRFNPLDGQGAGNKNVTEYRYALIESDTLEPSQQNALIRELELPVACLSYSGNKSVHAIVKIDAADYKEYRTRVDFLYDVCKKNGLYIDEQNKNPSRLSRAPGFRRGDQKQFLMDTNIGKESWKEWKEWIESVNDDLPDQENLSDVWEDMPPLNPSLIDGVLRTGHKMLIAGPSKAGKSFAQINLSIAIAEGQKWFGKQCKQGRVLYVNLELDRASCLHRFKDMYESLGLAPKNINKIDIWNLRGKSIPMDKLAPKLIRRANKKDYIAIIIDPIYKVITGDENSADQMALFCNQFDKVCTELGCAVIYCHHHSKGAQGGKRSMDRASGSGVFARDPDALIDMIELEVPDNIKKKEEENAVISCAIDHLKRENIELPDNEDASASDYLKYCKVYLRDYDKFFEEQKLVRQKIKQRTAWRLDGTLREFPKFEPVNVWFEYPKHVLDIIGTLADLEPEENKAPFQRGIEKRKKQADSKKNSIENETLNAFETLNEDGKLHIKDLADYLNLSERTARRRVNDCKELENNKGTITRVMDMDMT